MNHILRERQLYRSDPIAHLLIEKLRCSPLSAGLLSIAIAVVLALLTALASNTLWSSSGQTVGLLQDPIPWIAAVIINPVVVGYFLWSFQAINNVIESLEVSDVVEVDKLEIERMSASIYFKRWRSILAIGSALSFSIVVFITQPNLAKSWAGSGFLPNLSITFGTLIGVYVGSVLVLNLISNIQILRNLLKRKKLNVNPLHPDRCGGLRPLSDYSLKAAYLIAILGIWVGIIGYQTVTQSSKQDYWYVYFAIFLYVVLSLACFFGPLLTAHQGMSKAKEDLLHEIARQFQADYSQIRNSLNEDSETLKKRTEKIRELRVFYTMTDEFPVWPFDTQTFRRYLLTIPAPLLAPLVVLLQKSWEILLQQWGINP